MPRRLVGSMVVLFLQVAVGRPALAATTSTVANIPPIEPVIFEYKIERTTEPLSLFNTLPPPLPLGQVRQLTQERTSSGSAATPGYFDPYRITPRRLPGGTLGPAAMSREGFGPSADRGNPATGLPLPLYEDTVVLTNDRIVVCRILLDKGASMKVELPNGLITDLPKRRIKQVSRKAPAR